MRFEKIHTRLSVEMTLWDKIKYLFGYKLDMSYCLRIQIGETNGKYEYAKVDSYECNTALWYSDRPSEVDAQLRFAKLHENE